jgi:hypothetical protein
MINFFKNQREKKLFFISLGARILVFSLILSWFGTIGFYSSNDAREYLRGATNIVSNGVFSQSASEPYVFETLNTPGYPLFLTVTAVLSQTVLLAVILQLLFISIATVFLYRLLLDFFPERVCFWGTLLFAIEPWNLYAFNLALSEALFMSMFIFSLYYFKKFFFESTQKNAIISGLLFSASILIRPIILYLVPVLILVFLTLKYGKIKTVIISVLVFTISAYSLVGLWSYRNYVNSQVFAFSAKGPFTLYFYDVAQYIIYRDGTSPGEVDKNLIAMAHADHPEITGRNDLKNIIYGDHLTKKSIGLIKENPTSFIKVHLISIGTFLFSDGYRLLLREANISKAELPNISMAIAQGNLREIFSSLKNNWSTGIIFVTGFVFWASVNILAFGSFFIAWYRKENRERLVIISLFLMLILYFAVIVGPVAQARYRIPVTIFIFPLAFQSLFSLMSMYKTWKTKRLMIRLPS